jgi:WD40 repeat protein
MPRICLPTSCWLAFVVLLAGLACSLDALLPREPRWSLEGHQCLHVSADGTSLITFSEKPPWGQVVLRDLATGMPRRTLVASAEKIDPSAISPDHRWFALTLHRQNVHFFDLRDGSERRLPVETAEVRVLVFSPDAKFLVVELVERRVLLFDVATGAILLEVQPAGGLSPGTAFTPDHAYFLSPGDESHQPQPLVRAWDLRQRRWAFDLEGTHWVHGISPDGKVLYGSGRPSANVSEEWLWDLPRQRRQRLELGEIAKRFSRWGFSPDGRVLALWTDWTPDARAIFQLQEAPSGRLVKEIRSPPALRGLPRFSPDGRYLVGIAPDTDSAPPSRDDLYVYEAATGRLPWRRPWRRHGDEVWATALPAFAADAQSLATFGTAAGSVDFVDLATGSLQGTMPLHGAPDFSVNGRALPTPDQRFYILAASSERPNTLPWLTWLQSWLPGVQGGFCKQAWVLDLKRRSVVATLASRAAGFMDNAEEWLTADGRTLVTHDAVVRGQERRIDCWDLPPARPWRWILGPPVALGLFVLLAHALLRVRLRAVGVSGAGPTRQVI